MFSYSSSTTPVAVIGSFESSSISKEQNIPAIRLFPVWVRKLQSNRPPPALIQVYESLHYKLPLAVKKTIADLLQEEKKHIVVNIWTCKVKRVAMTIFHRCCDSIMPQGESCSFRVWPQVDVDLWSHLLKTFEIKDLVLVSFKSNPSVDCTCRLPDDGWQMVQCCSCNSWYHINCVCENFARQQWTMVLWFL